MFSRKFMTMGISVLLTAMLFTVPAFAHGHHSRGHHHEAETSCRTEAYAGNGTKAGCGVHGYAREDCGACAGEEAEISCPAHVYGAGKGNCFVCTLEGCVQTGHHLHEDTVYCGYPHACGYCDGTCTAADSL